MKDTDGEGCSSEKYQEQWIVDIVKTVVQKQIALMLDMDRLCRDKKQSIQQSTESAQTAATRLDNEITQLQAFKRQLYERYKGGTLDKTEYFKEREAIEHNISAKTAEREALLTQNIGQESAFNSAQHFFGSFTAYQADAEPTAEVVNALVEAVFVFGKDRIEVRFSFMDELEQAMLAFEGVSTRL
jgi:hypothetical protein